MKIFLHGADGCSWSIDKDRENILKVFRKCGIQVTKNILCAKYIHTLWWNSFIESNFFYFKFLTRLNATCSNFIDPSSNYFILYNEFKKAKDIVTTWICPSSKQVKILDKLNLKTFYMPFLIDYEFFSSYIGKTKQEICLQYGIQEEFISNKCVIGSFQRDSLGNDLKKPKFQKNPDGIIEVLKHVDKSKFILLLAGPRRHYIISQCKKYNIPYHYIGNETDDDDILFNTCSINTIRDLYAITDVVLCTSVTEGGPKCVLEASATGTLCISTDVGCALDFLPQQLVSNDLCKLGKILFEYIQNNKYFVELAKKSQETCKQKLSDDARMRYIRKLYNVDR